MPRRPQQEPVPAPKRTQKAVNGLTTMLSAQVSSNVPRDNAGRFKKT
jgi:hypothetical protein